MVLSAVRSASANYSRMLSVLAILQRVGHGLEFTLWRDFNSVFTDD